MKPPIYLNPPPSAPTHHTINRGARQLVTRRLAEERQQLQQSLSLHQQHPPPATNPYYSHPQQHPPQHGSNHGHVYDYISIADRSMHACAQCTCNTLLSRPSFFLTNQQTNNKPPSLTLITLHSPSHANNDDPFPAMAEADPDLKFTYEEESDPGRFFVPYIWEVLVARTRCVCRVGCCWLGVVGLSVVRARKGKKGLDRVYYTTRVPPPP